MKTLTRANEISTWKSIANALDLKQRKYNIFRGDCPYGSCGMPRLFIINIDKNYAECLACGNGGDSLDKVVDSLVLRKNL